MDSRQKNDVNFSQGITLSVILAVGVLVVVRLLFWNDIVTITLQSGDDRSDFDAVSALAYSERVAQVAELTIVTVLTLGGAILALNWYTSNRNFQDERERVLQLEDDAKSRIDQKLGEGLAEFRDTIKQIGETQDSSRKDLDGLAEETRRSLVHLSDAIAQTLQGSYVSTRQRGPAVLEFIGYELVPLASSLNVLQMLEPTEGRQVAALQMVNNFVNRFGFVFDWDPKNRLPNHDLVMMDLVSQYLANLQAEQPLSRWQEFRERFTIEEEPEETIEPTTPQR